MVANKNILVNDISECSVEYCIKIISGKWKASILFLISNDVNRFGEIRRNLPQISKQVLSRQLNELVQCNLLKKIEFDEPILRIEYKMTKLGLSLFEILVVMKKWGDRAKLE